MNLMASSQAPVWEEHRTNGVDEAEPQLRPLIREHTMSVSDGGAAEECEVPQIEVTERGSLAAAEPEPEPEPKPVPEAVSSDPRVHWLAGVSASHLPMRGDGC